MCRQITISGSTEEGTQSCALMTCGEGIFCPPSAPLSPTLFSSTPSPGTRGKSIQIWGASEAVVVTERGHCVKKLLPGCGAPGPMRNPCSRRVHLRVLIPVHTREPCVMRLTKVPGTGLRLEGEKRPGSVYSPQPGSCQLSGRGLGSPTVTNNVAFYSSGTAWLGREGGGQAVRSGGIQACLVCWLDP